MLLARTKKRQVSTFRSRVRPVAVVVVEVTKVRLTTAVLGSTLCTGAHQTPPNRSRSLRTTIAVSNSSHESTAHLATPPTRTRKLAPVPDLPPALSKLESFATESTEQNNVRNLNRTSSHGSRVSGFDEEIYDWFD